MGERLNGWKIFYEKVFLANITLNVTLGWQNISNEVNMW